MENQSIVFGPIYLGSKEVKASEVEYMITCTWPIYNIMAKNSLGVICRMLKKMAEFLRDERSSMAIWHAALVNVANEVNANKNFIGELFGKDKSQSMVINFYAQLYESLL